MTEAIKPSMQSYHRHVLICTGAKCNPNGEDKALALYEEFKIKLKNAGLDEGVLRVQKSRASCLGTCQSGPLVCVQPDGVWYYDINSTKLDKIITQHLLHNQPVTEYIYHQQ